MEKNKKNTTTYTKGKKLENSARNYKNEFDYNKKGLTLEFSVNKRCVKHVLIDVDLL